MVKSDRYKGLEPISDWRRHVDNYRIIEDTANRIQARVTELALTVFRGNNVAINSLCKFDTLGKEIERLARVGSADLRSKHGKNY